MKVTPTGLSQEHKIPDITFGKLYDAIPHNEDYGGFKIVDDRGIEAFYNSDWLEEATMDIPATRNKYSREIVPGVFVDVYQVLRAFNVTDPCLQHMLKKCLAAGVRGHKNEKEDLQDILASAKRALEMHEEWEGKS